MKTRVSLKYFGVIVYVDDTPTSFNSSSEALEFYSVCKQVLFEGGLQKNIREKYLQK